MSHDLARLDGLLEAALADPARTPDFFFAAAATGAAGDAAQRTLLRHLDAVAQRIALPRNAAPAPESRVAALAVGADGAVLQIAPETQSWLAEILPGGVAAGQRLPLLDQPPLQQAFQTVISGRATSQWRDCAAGRIGFAAAAAKGRAVANEARDRLVVLVIAPAPGVSQDGGASAVPIALARLFRLASPATPKLPREWLIATPPRKIFKLKDGRDLAFRVYGAPDSFPVFMFTSVVTSTLGDPFLANAAIRQGLKLVYIARPGLGASTPVAQITRAGVAEDAAELAQALDVKRLHLYGSGSACHFAFAAAKRFGDRVGRIALHAPRLSRPDPQNQTALGQFWARAAANAWLLESIAALFDRTRLTPGIAWIFARISSVGPQDDAILHGQDILAYETAQCLDATVGGLKGVAAEVKLLATGVVEDFTGIGQPVHAFAGALNTSLSYEDLEGQAARLGNVQVTRFPGVGIQFTEANADEMMRWLAQGGG